MGELLFASPSKKLLNNIKSSGDRRSEELTRGITGGQ